MNRFTAIGTISFNKDTSKYPFYREGKTKKEGKAYKSLNLNVAPEKSNRINADIFGMIADVIKANDKDGNKIEVAWADRTDEGVLGNVANYCMTNINLSDDWDARKSFLSAYDAIDYIRDHKDGMEGKTLAVSGRLRKDVYNGKARDRFEIQSIYVPSADAKAGIKLTIDFFWKKDGVDTSEFDKDKKIYFDGYVEVYIDGKNQYVPQRIVFDCSKIDFDNEKHMQAFLFRLSSMNLAYENGKIVNKARSSKVYAQQIEISYFNGAEQVEFDESQLTPYQKQMVDMGLKQLSDFRPAGQAYGDRITVYKIVNFTAHGAYAEGCVEWGDAGDFEDSIYVAPVEEESLASAINPPVVKDNADVSEESDDEEGDTEDWFN